jgi:hypothetical protein
MEPVDPIAVATNSASLTRAVRLRPLGAGEGNAMGPIELLDAESRALAAAPSAATPEAQVEPHGRND